jgi:hypothetical protein
MKKLFRISFLLAVLCFAVTAYADDGDMPTGTKTCTQNCGAGLVDETNPTPTVSDSTEQNKPTIEEIYSWIYEQISELVD